MGCGMCDSSIISNECESDERRQEKIDGVVYNMAPNTDWRHTATINNIQALINRNFKGRICRALTENIGLLYNKDNSDKDKQGDYLCPDVIVVCDVANIKNGYYNGVPKFVAEVLSRSTAKRDRTIKFKAYERLGVDEYWIVTPSGIIETYYLDNGKYALNETYDICRDKESFDYNENTQIALRCYPKVIMTLGEIFE